MRNTIIQNWTDTTKKDTSKLKILKKLHLFSIVFYILMTYKSNLFFDIGPTIAVYLLLFMGIAVLLADKPRALGNSYAIFVIVFLVICYISYVYSVSESSTADMNYQVLTGSLISLFVAMYIDCDKDVVTILRLFSVAGGMLFILMLLTGQLTIENITAERLGTTLYGNANTFSANCLFCGCAALYLMLQKQGTLSVILNLYVALAMLTLIALSGGRKYFIALILFLIIFLFLRQKGVNRHGGALKVIVIGGICIFVLFFTVINVPVLYESIGFRFVKLFDLFGSDGGNTLTSDSLRIDLVRYALDYFKQRPIFGWGNNGFSYLFMKETGAFAYSHNNYAELLVNFGLFGFLIYYSYYVYVLVNLYKTKKSALRDCCIAIVLILFILEFGYVTYVSIMPRIFVGICGYYLGIKRHGMHEPHRRPMQNAEPELVHRKVKVRLRLFRNKRRFRRRKSR